MRRSRRRFEKYFEARDFIDDFYEENRMLRHRLAHALWACRKSKRVPVIDIAKSSFQPSLAEALMATEVAYVNDAQKVIERRKPSADKVAEVPF